MQGWLFVNGAFWKDPQIKALLPAVPKGKMIILDLYSEQSPIFTRTESYYGQPFIWCMLHNFGGLNEMYGELDKVNEGPFNGRNFPNSTMVGTGLTPEGINQNEVMYEFMNEQAWRPGSVNTTEWIDLYQAQRYGGGDPKTSDLGLISGKASTLSTYLHYPRISTIHMGYDPEMLFKAWDNMVAATFTTPALHAQTLFRYDLVDVSRNSLQVLAIKYYSDVIAAYNKSDTASLRSAGVKMIDLLSDLDTLLATDVHFLLGTWTSDAARHFSTPQEKALYDYNSRNQVTLWGPSGQIMDYACKIWSGLINRYYKPRWQLFINTLINCTETKTSFDSGVYGQEVFDTVEIPFSYDQTDFPNEPEVQYSIEYKLLMFVFKAIHHQAPSYLEDLIHKYEPARSLRSSATLQLTVPRTRTVQFGDRSFIKAGPTLWNKLPQNFQTITDFETFKREIKTPLFQRAYGLRL
ncbi:alpha-N-acetylglucosaminidase-like [Haliotis rubra]|uniref:alpha-N-acetylglucosaminidase-like n=1 Tax=Haliotis rubra TaxID=36100 RepID=UPI001EE54834|nr:alpha-N-acetylglucosaminidase-like [Haliotis rubra]